MPLPENKGIKLAGWVLLIFLVNRDTVYTTVLVDKLLEVPEVVRLLSCIRILGRFACVFIAINISKDLQEKDSKFIIWLFYGSLYYYKVFGLALSASSNMLQKKNCMFRKVYFLCGVYIVLSTFASYLGWGPQPSPLQIQKQKLSAEVMTVVPKKKKSKEKDLAKTWLETKKSKSQIYIEPTGVGLGSHFTEDPTPSATSEKPTGPEYQGQNTFIQYSDSESGTQEPLQWKTRRDLVKEAKRERKRKRKELQEKQEKYLAKITKAIVYIVLLYSFFRY
uniref:Uncharacterized protein n=1 Tax=Caulerpa racemosa TaxID=76317 RepID=A0A1I9LKC3_CAURA|nr:hypothetical protein [Caulerpa racemosa]ANJ70784.1 hypothetical protein [Caulerpa racemosa]